MPGGLLGACSCGSLVWLGLATIVSITGLYQLHGSPTCPCSSVLRGGCYGGGSCSAGGPSLGDDVEVVIAHCKHSMDFLEDMRGDIVSAGLRLKLILIVAKCGETAALRALQNSASHELWGVLKIVQQPNVGRCDHSWASHIATNYRTLASRLIMIKDSWADHNIFERLNGSALVAATASGFACAYGNLQCKLRDSTCKLGKDEHLWHSAAELLSFRISNYQKPWDQSNHSITSDFQARHRPLGNWMLSLQLASHVETRRYLPVCYGGGFVAARSAVHRVPVIAWRRIVESLSRGDNVEESHYMERMWAALLTPPLTPSETRAMACVAKTADRVMLAYLMGSVNNCICGDVERCGAGLTYWGLRAAATEDEEEEVRIREETEKLEKMTQEFTDIDGDGVIVDSDLLASLRKRMGNSTVVKGDNDPDGQGPADDSNGGGGGSATLKHPPSEPRGGAADH